MRNMLVPSAGTGVFMCSNGIADPVRGAEDMDTMGKLIEKLGQVGQSSGGGFGFLSNARGGARAPRPAAILVSVGAGDAALAEAALRAGADGVIVMDWTPSTDTKAFKAAAEQNSAVWGVEYSVEGQAEGGVLRSAQEAGAAFAVVTPQASAVTLLDDLERFDVVVAVDPPQDDLGIVLMRAENLLPAQAVLLRFQFTAADVNHMTVTEFARLRFISESLRFPRLVTLNGAEPQQVRTLVRLGSDAVVLTGSGLTAASLEEQVKAFRDELEKTPPRRETGTPVALGGLVPSATPQPSKPEPQKDPDHE